MANLVVYRGANRLWIRRVSRWRIVERRRDGALLVYHVFMAQLIELCSGDPGFYVGSDEIQHFGREPSGYAHFFDIFYRFDGD